MTSTPNAAENEEENFPTNPIPANADTDDDADDAKDDSQSQNV